MSAIYEPRPCGHCAKQEVTGEISQHCWLPALIGGWWCCCICRRPLQICASGASRRARKAALPASMSGGDMKCDRHNRRRCGQCFGVKMHAPVHSGADRCPHDGLPHDSCAHSKPCLGDCGKRTTAYEGCAPGYCAECSGCVPSSMKTGVVIFDGRDFDASAPEVRR